MSTTPARRPRPHPAQRARKIAGVASVASMFVLTGYMAATTKTATNPSSTNAASANTAAAAVTANTTGSASRSATVAAGSGTISSQSITSTHGS